jgi:threonine/homoserine/homoserine lactone efflux protein
MSTFLLTLANPMTMLSFAALFAGLGVTPAAVIKGTNSAAAAMVAGVFLGSALWWLILSSAIGRLRHYIGARTLTLINRLSGTVLTAFGLYAIASLVLLR